MSNSIRFSHNYKKLNDRIFTTVRPYNAAKEVHYKNHIGHPFNLIVKNNCIGVANLLQVIQVYYADLTQEFIDYDTEGLFHLKPVPQLLLIFERIA